MGAIPGDSRPFGLPETSVEITLDLPAPLSVNQTRKIDWRAKRKIDAWTKQADDAYLLQKRRLPGAIDGPFEISIMLRDGSRVDADNTAKIIIDSLRRYRLIPDDNPKYMRRLIIEFGDVEGCRVHLRSLHG